MLEMAQKPIRCHFFRQDGARRAAGMGGKSNYPQPDFRFYSI
jgi:hypothetical protein